MLLEISMRKAAQENTPTTHEASSSNISSNINNACVIEHDKGKNVLNAFKHSDHEKIVIVNPLLLIYSSKKGFSKTNFLFLLINYMSRILMDYMNKKSLIK
jgi:hypothetical protein